MGIQPQTLRGQAELGLCQPWVPRGSEPPSSGTSVGPQGLSRYLLCSLSGGLAMWGLGPVLQPFSLGQGVGSPWPTRRSSPPPGTGQLPLEVNDETFRAALNGSGTGVTHGRGSRPPG